VILKVRTTPIDVFYCTDEDARLVRSDADGVEYEVPVKPCFCTAAFGHDGFAWDTCEEFEADHDSSWGQKYMKADATRHSSA